jgi:PAS domain S-box-containing protein
MPQFAIFLDDPKASERLKRKLAKQKWLAPADRADAWVADLVTLAQLNPPHPKLVGWLTQLSPNPSAFLADAWWLSTWSDAELMTGFESFAELPKHDFCLSATFEQWPQAQAVVRPNGTEMRANLAARQLLSLHKPPSKKSNLWKLGFDPDWERPLVNWSSKRLRVQRRLLPNGRIWLGLEEATQDLPRFSEADFENSPEPMLLCQAGEQRILDANDAALQYFGYTRQEILEIPPSTFLPNQGELSLHRHRDGHLLWLKLRRLSIVHESHPAELWQILDQSELKELRLELDQQERRSQVLFALPRLAEELSEEKFLEAATELVRKATASSNAVIQLVDSQQTPLCCCCADFPGSENTEGKRNCGQCQAFKGAPGDYLVCSAQGDRQLRLLLGVTGKKVAYDIHDNKTLQLIAKEIWHLVDRRRTEEKLNTLSQAIEQSPESIVITNLNGDIEYVNEAFSKISGYSPTEVIGKNPRVLQSGRTPSETYREMWGALTRGQVWRGTFFNRRKDGTDYTESAIVSPVRQSDGRMTHYLAIKADVTEKLRLAEELSKHQHHLEELVAQRTLELAQAREKADSANQAKSQFLANMSHEIRTPLNAIVGLAYLVRQTVTTPEQQSRLNQLNDSCRHLLNVVSDILDRAKIEAGQSRLVESNFRLDKLLLQVQGLVAKQARAKGLALEVDTNQANFWLRGDATRIRQCLLNYLTNAIKFTTHGKIRVSFLIQERLASGSLIRFEVRDTGPGIPPEQVPRLFQTFEQLDEGINDRPMGSGLGLAINRQLVSLLGGELGVNSQPGEGSTFWFTAKVRPGTQAIEYRKRLPEAQCISSLRNRFSGTAILLVEDNPTNRDVLLELLANLRLKIDWAENGLQAVERCRAENYALILMDMQMPVMDGITATQLIRSELGKRELPILALTAGAFEDDRQRCLDAGMNDFLAKPIDPPELYAALWRHLSGEEVHKPNLLPAQDPPVDTIESKVELELPGVDVARGLMMLNGDEHRYRQLLRSLLERLLQESQQLPGESDLEVSRRWAHSFRGAAATIGANLIASQALELEKLARNSQWSNSLVQEICEQARLLLEKLGQTSLQPPQELHLPLDWKAFAKQVSLSQAGALDYAESHRSELEREMGPDAQRLLSSLEEFDFPNAEKLILPYLEQSAQNV